MTSYTDNRKVEAVNFPCGLRLPSQHNRQLIVDKSESEVIESPFWRSGGPVLAEMSQDTLSDTVWLQPGNKSTTSLISLWKNRQDLTVEKKIYTGQHLPICHSKSLDPGNSPVCWHSTLPVPHLCVSVAVASHWVSTPVFHHERERQICHHSSSWDQMTAILCSDTIWLVWIYWKVYETLSDFNHVCPPLGQHWRTCFSIMELFFYFQSVSWVWPAHLTSCLGIQEDKDLKDHRSGWNHRHTAQGLHGSS